MKKRAAGEPTGRRVPRFVRHAGTDVTYSGRQHVPMTAYKPEPCKLVVKYDGASKRWGVYNKTGRTLQMFNSREAAKRQQADCKRAAGVKGLGKMAKSKKPKKSVASRKARGKFCVFAPSGKLFNCYEKKQSAENMAAGMNKSCRKRGQPASWTLKVSGR